MEIMNGKELSSKIKDEIKDEVESCFKTPILAVITIGYNAASEVYIKNKKKACEYVGMSLLHFDYVDSVKEKVVINKNFIDREKGPGVHREVCIDRMEFNPDGTIRKVVPTL